MAEGGRRMETNAPAAPGEGCMDKCYILYIPKEHHHQVLMRVRKPSTTTTTTSSATTRYPQSKILYV